VAGTILIVKVGGTLPALAGAQGDFEDWIRRGLGPAGVRAGVVDVRRGEDLPAPGGLDGVVVSGSHASVTDREGWSEVTAGWLAGVVALGVPVLGICYGHQLLAHALGGRVADNPNGLEFGTVAVHLAEEAGEDALLGGVPNPLPAQVCHRQSVLRLPPGAVRLATSALDGCQAFRVADSAWGVQFHPEFNGAAVRAYVDEYREELAAGGQDPDAIRRGVAETPQAAGLLRRFAQITTANPP
jgi:GMP synthase (glutamine-hydrolysing)